MFAGPGHSRSPLLRCMGHLVADMRYLRKARAEGKDTSFLEQTCAFYVAWMGHYIGDGSQPLHDTIHHVSQLTNLESLFTALSKRKCNRLRSLPYGIPALSPVLKVTSTTLPSASLADLVILV